MSATSVTGNETRTSTSQEKEKFSLRERVLIVTLAVIVAVSSFDFLDQYAGADLDALFKRALISFALARTLNGVISVVQGTEVALQPAGVGVTLTPGQILDPINDLVERFSWIMLGATISLGIQQVLLEVGQWWGVRVLLVVTALSLLALRLWRRNRFEPSPRGFEQALVYMLVAAVFIRFAVPLALIANEVVYDLFLESRYLASTQELEAAGQMLEGEKAGQVIGSTKAEEDETRSILGQAIDGARKTLDFEQKIAAIKQKTSQLIEHLIQLSVVFVLQTAILPLVFLWILLSILRLMLKFRPQFAALQMVKS